MVTGGQDPFGLNRAFWAPPDGVSLVRAAAGGPTGVVILDRVDEVDRDATSYCIHGQTTCAGCQAWCWLGDKTLRIVQAGDTVPMCRPCALEHLERSGVRLVDNAVDHRRSDGPHRD